MWLLCDCYFVFMWLLCGWYVVVMWLLCCSYVVAMWLLCDCYVVAIWMRCGCYAVAKRFLCGCYAVAMPLQFGCCAVVLRLQLRCSTWAQDRPLHAVIAIMLAIVYILHSYYTLWRDSLQLKGPMWKLKNLRIFMLWHYWNIFHRWWTGFFCLPKSFLNIWLDKNLTHPAPNLTPPPG